MPANAIGCMQVDTFDLLPSLAQGDLHDTSVAELVAAVFRSRASGTLAIESKGTGEIRTFFRTGDMCGSATFSGFRTLAHVLLANDWADALQIESTQQAATASGKRHGEVLVEKGLLTPDRLRVALATQHRENLRVLLALAEGTYEWRGTEPPPAWAREVTVDPVSCIVDALESDAMDARRARVLEWLGAQPVRLSVDWPELKSRVALEEAERRAAALLSVPRTTREFVGISQLPPARAEALLAALLLAGGAEPADASAPAARGAPAREEAQEMIPLEQLPEEAASPVEPLDPHADVQRRLEAAAADDEPLELDRDEEAETRARDLRKRMLQRGLRNLGIAPQIEGGELEIEAPRPPQAAVPKDVDDATRAFIEEVQHKASSVDTQNAYQRLGIPPKATTEQIKQAYLAAAKRYHPDRGSSSPALTSILPDLEMLFSALKNAYDSIGTSAARTQYDQQLKHGTTGKMGTRKEEASLSLKMGDVLLKRRDFEGAVAKLRRAVDLDANADSLAALAWGLVSDPKQPAASKEEAMSLINRALRAPGPTARTYYVAGVLWRTKDPASAADAFRKALQMDPKHADASLELRLLETRQGKAAAVKEGGVLSSLLFGRRKP